MSDQILEATRTVWNPDVMYKFGQTSLRDAAYRLSPAYAESRGFRGVAIGTDYRDVTMWSTWVDKDVANKLEDSFKRMISKELYTTVDYNGISECRCFTDEQVNLLLANLRKRFPADKYYWQPGKQKVYFKKLIKKVKYER